MVMSFFSINLLSQCISHLFTQSDKVSNKSNVNLDHYQYVIAFIETTTNDESIQEAVIHFADDNGNQSIIESNDNTVDGIETTALMNVNVPVPIMDNVLEGGHPNEECVPVHRLKRKCIPPVSALVEKRTEELSWYYLFPTGENGLNEDRLIHITPLDYFQTCILGSDQRFHRLDYLFYALSIVEFFKATNNIQ